MNDKAREEGLLKFTVVCRRELRWVLGAVPQLSSHAPFLSLVEGGRHTAPEPPPDEGLACRCFMVQN